MDEDWGLKVLKALRGSLGPVSMRETEPFKVLVATILSQHTTDVKAHEAYRRLASKLEIAPKALAGASPAKVAEAIRVAGLQRNKARAIVELSRRLLTVDRGLLDELSGLSLEEARRRLIRLPGVGLKTADIVLLFSYGKPTFPIDTHIFRVSKRLGLRARDEGYETVRRRLQRIFPAESYLEAHLLLIRLGRVYCKPRRPRCGECPLVDLCPKIIDPPEGKP